MIDAMEFEGLRGFVQRAIFCPGKDCGKVLDVNRAVEVTVTMSGKIITHIVVCQACSTRAMGGLRIVLKREGLTDSCTVETVTGWLFDEHGIRTSPEPVS